VLTVVSGRPTSTDEEELERLYNAAVPYGATYLHDVKFRVETGDPAEVILQAAAGADLLVAGTHGRAGLAALLLGSTSTPLLQRTEVPVLLVPPTDIDIVTLDFTNVGLHFGVILAAVDINEHNRTQLEMASRMADLARRPLMALTVAGEGISDHDAAAALRTATKGLDPHATAFIVRRGEVAEEIARGALHEQAGLVVMGLRRQGRGRPGKVATAVARTGRALVLAVPE
jgi:nucleotide-binding universal stress UspA family protein